ncbi:hypothetical protein [Micromonospora sp. LOL_024]|uniref:hypothetical protein n=1 Tax=Micromonospora sp. LOL_024 TaxID=3345412 RepID=UPI003A877EB2
MTAGEQRRQRLVTALEGVIPDAVHGVFRLNDHHLNRVPTAAHAAMSTVAGWWVLAYAVPVTDEGLWVWHHHGEYRSLMANYVLARAREAMQASAAAGGEELVSLTRLTSEGVSMVEVGELAGLGNRGWNNLLLHPRYGSWLQIEALATPEPLGAETPAVPEDVCVKCMNCINDCPAGALSVDDFDAVPCAQLVAAPWNPRSRAIALTAQTYIECRECINSCPIGEQPEGILAWRR